MAEQAVGHVMANGPACEGITDGQFICQLDHWKPFKLSIMLLQLNVFVIPFPL
jgi:hypothetical protein